MHAASSDTKWELGGGSPGGRTVILHASTPVSLLNAVQQSGLLDQLIEQPLLVHKSCRCVKFCNVSMIEDDDTVRVHDSVDPVRDCDDGSIFEHVAAQCRLQHSISLDVDSRGSFVKNWPKRSCQK